MLEIFKVSYELSANYSHVVPFIWHNTFLEQRLKDEGKVVPDWTKWQYIQKQASV